MSELHPKLQELLQRTAEVEQAALDQSDPSRRVRQRLLADQARVTSRRRSRLAYLVAACLATAAVVGIARPWRRTLNAQFDDGRPVDIQPGEPLQAGRSAGAVLRFSDGSVIRMNRDTRASVAAIDSYGATVSLEGTAEVSVQHRASSRWTIEAGPFAVQVTGTRFDVGWDVDKKQFDIRMTEGAVSISGCSLSALQLRAPQSMRARCDAGQADISMREPAPPEPVSVDSSAPIPPIPSAVEAPAVTVEAPRAAPERSEAPAPPEPPDAGLDVPKEPSTTWRDLAAAGRYREAYALAESEGFQAQCDSSTASDLLALADGARFAGRGDRARTALLCVRRRFRGSSSAAVAAFRLGALAFDDGRSFGEAAQWFRTYLQEQPKGTFSREASGRLIEAEKQAGNAAVARDLARDYLQRWPNGPHAALARSLVGDGT